MEANKQYLGLNDEEYNEHCRLMQLRMTDWLGDLQAYVREITQRLGSCGDVTACAVADWLKSREVNDV